MIEGSQIMVGDSLNKTGANLLIKALQENNINRMYGIVGIPVTDLARLAELRGMKYYGFAVKIQQLMLPQQLVT